MNVSTFISQIMNVSIDCHCTQWHNTQVKGVSRHMIMSYKCQGCTLTVFKWWHSIHEMSVCGKTGAGLLNSMAVLQKVWITRHVQLNETRNVTVIPKYLTSHVTRDVTAISNTSISRDLIPYSLICGCSSDVNYITHDWRYDHQLYFKWLTERCSNLLKEWTTKLMNHSEQEREVSTMNTLYDNRYCLQFGRWTQKH